MRIFWLILLIFPLSWAMATDAENVPGKIQFADMELELDKEARAMVNAKVEMLREDRLHLREFHERALLYFPLIEKVLRAENVPSDFKYLALQESMLLPNTTSRSDAVGYWQLKDFTAKELGLRIDAQVDERKHAMAATAAAAKYLKKNHYFMQNWLYTLLSYRLGITGTNNLIDRKYIGATRMKLDGKMHTYIAHFLAYKLVFNRPIGQPTYTLFEYANAEGKPLTALEKVGQVDLNLIRQHNQWLKTTMVPSNLSYPLLLPVFSEKQAEVVSQLGLTLPSATEEVLTSPEEVAEALSTTSSTVPTNSVSNTTPNSAETQQDTPDPSAKYPVLKEKRVQKIAGEEVTLVTANGIPAFIAGRFKNSYAVLEGLGISDSKFRKYNEMTKFETLIPGQVYYLKKKDKKGPIAEHITRRGETIWKVAQRFGIRSKSIVKFNRMSEGEDLVAGRVLLLQEKRSKKSKPQFKEIPQEPKTNTNPALPNNGQPTNPTNRPNTTRPNTNPSTNSTQPSNAVVNNRFHIVKEGENVFSISRDYGITPLQIQQWNDLPQDLALTTGQILIVKGEEVASSTTTKPEDAPFDPLANVILIDDEGNPLNGKKNQPEGDDKREPLPGDDPAGTNVKEITHVVQRGETLYKIARKYEVEEDQIIAWNKLNNRFVRPGQRLKIVQVETGNLTLNEETWDPNSSANNTAEAEKPQKPKTPATHTVASGETLYSIARKYKVTFKEIMQWNQMGNNSTIVVGQVLKVEDPAEFMAASSETTSEPAAAEGVASTSETVPEGYHLVKQGETLYDVAFRYNLTQTELREWNNLSATDNIAAGDRLIVNRILAHSVISRARQKPSTAPKTRVHTVADGETLYRISLKYGVDVADLQKWNNLRGSTISKGQQLIVGYTPGIEQASMATSQPTRQAATTPSPVYHTVKKGETLYSIARRYKVDQADIKRLSNKTSDQLSVGEKLRIK